jgi:hypothetical protein
VLAAGQAIAAVARQLVHEVLDGLATALGRLVRYAGAGLSWLQSGSLPMYVAWVLLGATVFYLVIFLR